MMRKEKPCICGEVAGRAFALWHFTCPRHGKVEMDTRPIPPFRNADSGSAGTWLLEPWPAPTHRPKTT